MPAIGLTGTIGSGKSLVAEQFRELGAAVIDADELAREAVKRGTDGLQLIAGHFGARILTAEGDLDRKALGSIVFNDPAERRQLESILHPRIRQLFRKRLAELQSQDPTPSLIIYAVPLLFESGYSYEELDRVIVVAAPYEVCKERIMKRDGSSAELAAKKLSAQLSSDAKASRGDFVINNDGSILSTRAQVEKIFHMLRGDEPAA